MSEDNVHVVKPKASKWLLCPFDDAEMRISLSKAHFNKCPVAHILLSWETSIIRTFTHTPEQLCGNNQIGSSEA